MNRRIDMTMYAKILGLVIMSSLASGAVFAEVETQPATTSAPTTVAVVATMPATVPTTMPASAPATMAATEPAETVSLVDSKVEAILDKLETAGSNIKDLQAKVTHELYQIIPDDRQVKLGVIGYRAATEKDPPKFVIHFNTLLHDDLKLTKQEWFCFDGRWFREIREQTCAVIDREVVAPGEKFDPFKLGEGPFPLPFGQKKADILKEFEVKLVPPAKGDPTMTDHLVMIPRKTGNFTKKYKQVDFWIAKDNQLPMKIVSEDLHSNIITATFQDIRINAGIPDDMLWLPVPENYSYTREALN
jgi:hypothetical protein